VGLEGLKYPSAESIIKSGLNILITDISKFLKEWGRGMSKKMKINYKRGIEELKINAKRSQKLVQVFNQIDPGNYERKEEIIRELFGSVGMNPNIEHNFNCDFGYNIHVGDHFYARFNCTILDVAEVRIGHNCMIGPNVGIYTTGSLIESEDRNKSGYAIPINIGNDVWIGGSSVILPGITIGDNSIVAAGSVVTRDVPPNTIVAGNPARILKRISE
jgi:maltose O-acetyltransferase